MNKKMTLDQAMDRLAQVVQQLDNGSTPLDESMKLYSEGIKLAAFCDEKLRAAEQKFQTITAGEE